MEKKRVRISIAATILFVGFVICSCQGLVEPHTITSFGSIVPEAKIYFQCTFSKEGPNGFKINQSWPENEPCQYLNELGIWHWVNCGPDWGTLRLVSDPSDSNRTCLEMLLDAPGTRPLPNNQQVKLYECQGREAANYAGAYSTSKEAFWSMKYWFPANFKVETNSWRLIWQDCGEEGVYGDLSDLPQTYLVFGDSYLYLQNSEYYYSDGQGRSFEVISNTAIPKQRWVSMVVYLKQGTAFRAEDGTVIVWIDGTKVFERHDLSTSTYSGTPYVVWSIGNYGGPDEAEGQYIRIKDVTVTSAYPT